MPPAVVATAQLTCTFGVAPAVLNVIPTGPPVQIEGKLAGTIQTHVPTANIPPFGVCSSLANPTVAAATAAALGVLTPMPCVPVTAAPWTPGMPTVQIGGQPALVAGNLCTCAWGGVVSVVFAGSVQTQIG